jgi:DNA-binding transcriptional LysR family regulator
MSCPAGLQRAISDPMPAFLLENPLLRIQLVMTNRRVDLIEESIDIAIRVRERVDTDLDLPTKQIGASKRILVASPALLNRLGNPETPADLQNFPLLHQQEQPGHMGWSLANASGDEASIDVQPRLATGDLATLVHAACAGIGIALLPRDICEMELVGGNLIQVLPGWGVADGIIHIVYTSRRGMLPGVRAVIDFAAEALRTAAT